MKIFRRIKEIFSKNTNIADLDNVMKVEKLSNSCNDKNVRYSYNGEIWN